jgi:hypothetical protein
MARSPVVHVEAARRFESKFARRLYVELIRMCHIAKPRYLAIAIATIIKEIHVRAHR